MKRYPGSYTYSSAKEESVEVLRHMQIIDLWLGEIDPPEQPEDTDQAAKVQLERQLFG